MLSLCLNIWELAQTPTVAARAEVHIWTFRQKIQTAINTKMSKYKASWYRPLCAVAVWVLQALHRTALSGKEMELLGGNERWRETRGRGTNKWRGCKDKKGSRWGDQRKVRGNNWTIFVKFQTQMICGQWWNNHSVMEKLLTKALLLWT